ncbi:AI-2E family transporter [Anaerobranca gottschalkii]|uniref:Sporulation integral membrane protein YtvI n=1 Tax=Anaerobranca gottschalkii DSM 13577 TaxID=1120990 RepID=A0A1H9Y4T3_9FIRM|nr:AI-2E family transporter [Anaerobranca gottschalkii]SES63852.1 sporulation integral membrane protein YtvI [Anaerobranca gottschalkii DSM 13577]
MTIREFFSNKYVKLILKLGIIIFSLIVLYTYRQQIISLVTPFIISYILAYLLNPIVVLLEKRKIPRILGVMIIYLLFFLLIFTAIAKLIPVIYSEITRLESLVPEYSVKIREYIVDINEQINRLELPESIQQSIQKNANLLEEGIINFLKTIPQRGISAAVTTFQIFLVLVLTFYCLRDYYLIQDYLLRLISPRKQQKFLKVMGEIDESLGNYIRGQFIICSFIGVLTYLWLLIIGVDFSLILGIIAGVTNIIPYFGPFIGAVPSVIVALFTSPMLALKVAIGIIIIQQIESNLVAPQVLGKKMGMHPLLVIFSLLAGGKFFGIIGMIIGVPVMAIIRILVRNFLRHYLPEGMFKN